MEGLILLISLMLGVLILAALAVIFVGVCRIWHWTVEMNHNLIAIRRQQPKPVDPRAEEWLKAMHTQLGEIRDVLKK